jgi:hypothetical protein
MNFESSNFREIHMGKITSKILYRSNHPIYNKEQVSDIILAVNYVKINTVINLSDSIQSLISKVAFCPWYKKIYENNCVIPLDINMQFRITDTKFCKKLKTGLLFMIEHNPPYLIHCEAGIDRTGFLSLLLEAFMGAAFDDMVKDYMLSYVEDGVLSEYDYKDGSIFIQNMFSKIKGEPINSIDDLQAIAKEYLVEKIRLSNAETKLLENTLIGKVFGNSVMDQFIL